MELISDDYIQFLAKPEQFMINLNMRKNISNAAFLLVLLFSSLILSGCAAAMVAGGLVGGYFIGQNLDVKVHQK